MKAAMLASNWRATPHLTSQSQWSSSMTSKKPSAQAISSRRRAPLCASKRNSNSTSVLGFFEAVASCKFTVRAIVVDKAQIYSDNLRENKELLYNFFVKSLLQHDGNSLAGARVKIDGSGDREFKRELAAYLKRESAEGKIASVKFAESHRDNLIQLADMVAGAIARSYREGDRNEHDRWRKMLNSKVKNVWNFR